MTDTSSDDQKQYACSICSADLGGDWGIPNLVCPECAKRAKDETGRELDFYNTDLSGGFVAVYRDNEEERDSHVCFIDGIECHADEHILGGIIVQRVAK